MAAKPIISKMKRVLVTGAGGYIGQNLCSALLEDGWIVRGLDRSSQPSNLDGVEWFTCDILNSVMLSRAVAGTDAIIHLACLSLKESEREPLRASRTNVDGTINVLEVVRNEKIKRFIFASTCQIYGGRGTLPNRETDLPHPGSAYAASKFSAEMWCEAYRNMYQLPVQVLRLFNVYGPSVDGSHRPTVETLFLRQVKNEKRPNVFGNPQSGRDFIHIYDVTKAFLHVLNNPICDGPINIGTGVVTTIKELAYLAAYLLDKSIEPNLEENDDVAIRFQADTAKASKLGFFAQVDLENGLRQLAQNCLTG